MKKQNKLLRTKPKEVTNNLSLEDIQSIDTLNFETFDMLSQKDKHKVIRYKVQLLNKSLVKVIKDYCGISRQAYYYKLDSNKCNTLLNTIFLNLTNKKKTKILLIDDNI